MTSEAVQVMVKETLPPEEKKINIRQSNIQCEPRGAGSGDIVTLLGGQISVEAPQFDQVIGAAMAHATRARKNSFDMLFSMCF